MFENAIIKYKENEITITIHDSNEEENWFKKIKLILNIYTPNKGTFNEKFTFHFYREKSAKKLFNAICSALNAIGG